MIVLIHNDEVGLLARLPNALQNTLGVLVVRLVPFDAQLVHARPGGCGRPSLGNQAGCHRYEGDCALGCLQVSRRNRFLYRAPYPGVSQFQAAHLLECVLNARDLEIERMVVGQGHQVEA